MSNCPVSLCCSSRLDGLNLQSEKLFDMESVFKIGFALPLIFTGLELLNLCRQSGIDISVNLSFFLLSFSVFLQAVWPDMQPVPMLIASICLFSILLYNSRDVRIAWLPVLAVFSIVVWTATLFQIIIFVVQKSQLQELGMLYLSLVIRDATAAVYGRFFKGITITSISPRKTWQGAFVGFAATMSVWIILGTGLHHTFPYSLIQGGVAGVFGQIGDLAGSALKRAANVKHSGRLFGERGGLLDLLDSTLFTLPFWYSLSISHLVVL